MNYKRNQKISHPDGVTDYMNCQLVATLKTDVTHNLGNRSGGQNLII